MPPSLDAMHPLLYPDPPTSLWSVLMAIGLGLLSLTLLWWARKHYQRRNTTPSTAAEPAQEEQILQALLQLQRLPWPTPDTSAGPWLQQLNQLLKRVCAVRYAEEASHRLTGREWLAFLDSHCPAAGLTRWMILVEGGYQPNCHLDEGTVAGIYQAVEIWISKHV